MQFKALPLPGEPAAEPHFFYVSADMVRPMEICRSPTSYDDRRQSGSSSNANSTTTSTSNSKKAFSSSVSYYPNKTWCDLFNVCSVATMLFAIIF